MEQVQVAMLILPHAGTGQHASRAPRISYITTGLFHRGWPRLLSPSALSFSPHLHFSTAMSKVFNVEHQVRSLRFWKMFTVNLDP